VDFSSVQTVRQRDNSSTLESGTVLLWQRWASQHISVHPLRLQHRGRRRRFPEPRDAGIFLPASTFVFSLLSHPQQFRSEKEDHVGLWPAKHLCRHMPAMSTPDLGQARGDGGRLLALVVGLGHFQT